MKNKKLLLSALAVVLLILIGCGALGYEYWVQGTPEYSLSQLNEAITQHDSTTALEYLNTGAIWSNFWPRFESLYSSVNGTDSLSSSFALNLIASSTEQEFDTSIYQGITGEATTSSPALLIVSSLSGKKFMIHNNVATVAMTLNVQAGSFPIIVVFQQQSNRTWQITDMQGLENALIQGITQNNQAAAVPEASGSSATINPDSLISSTSTPTISGTFSNVGDIQIVITTQANSLPAEILPNAATSPGVVFGDTADHGGGVQMSTPPNSTSGTYSDKLWQSLADGTYYVGIYETSTDYNSNGFQGYNTAYLLSSGTLTVNTNS
jgi:hypothetical protein